jgi:PII-like signaling protein
MKLEREGKLLRVFIGENDRWEGKPLFEAIVLKVREMGGAGATVLRGIEGFGAQSRIHTARILRLSEDLPIVVEIVDTAERIDALLHVLDAMIRDGLVTVEDVHVVRYRPRGET